MDEMEIRRINKESLKDIEETEQQLDESDLDDGGDFGSSLVW